MFGRYQEEMEEGGGNTLTILPKEMLSASFFSFQPLFLNL